MGPSRSEQVEVEIVRTEGVLGGKPRLAGHRISVLDVTELLDVGYSIPETADQLDIPVGAVRAAARYFRHHRDELAAVHRRRRETHDDLAGAAEDQLA